MKTRTEMEAILDKTGIPYQYFMFEVKEAIPPPFMVWYIPGSNNFSADGIVYHKIDRLNIEVYTDTKDFDMEATVEQVLEEAGLFWNKTESYIEAEKLYEVLYEMEV